MSGRKKRSKLSKRKGHPGHNNKRLSSGQIFRAPSGYASGIHLQGHKAGISLCMIVRDEENTLPRCINSVRHTLSEIIAVDTGSSDNTVALARSLGAKVYNYTWSDDFSAARNFSLEKATGKWVLALDADETISEEDLPRIAALCERAEHRAFEFVTRNYVSESSWSNWVPNDGKYHEAHSWPGWFPSHKVRLFLNDQRVRYSGEIHELVEPSLEELGWRPRRVLIPVHHFLWERAPERLWEKKALYRECSLRKVQNNPHDPKAHYEYGIHCSETREYGEAMKAFSKVLSLAPDFAHRYQGLTNLYAYMGASLIKLGLHHEALSKIEEGLNASPGNADLLHLKGIAHAGQGCTKEAILAMEEAVAINPGFSKAYEALGITCYQAGENEKAGKALRRALSLNSHMSEAARVLKLMEGEKTNYSTLEKDSKYQTPAQNGGAVRLSVCIIARDEAHNLPGCIESIKGVADEVVVVDTGSTDNTVQVATTSGARVFHFPWCDDFSAARNEGIRRATGDYILWMDADDLLDGSHVPKLKKLKESLVPGERVAYLLLLQNRKNGIDDDVCYQLRLFPNLPGVAFEGRVHEQVVYSLERLGVEQRQAEIKIVHQGYFQQATMEAKVRRNIRLLLEEEREQLGDFVRNFQLAGSYFFIGEAERAIEHMEEAVYGEGDRRRSPLWHLSAYIQLGWMYKTTGRVESAMKTLQEALAMDPGNGLAKFFLGEIKYSMGQQRDALKELSSISDEDFPVTVFALPLAKIRHLLYFYRGRCHEELGEYEKAVNEYIKAQAIDSGTTSIKRHLSAAYLKQGRWREAEEILGGLSMAESEEPAVLNNLGLVRFRRGDTSGAEQLFRRAISINPHLLEARVNLGLLLLKKGLFSEARLHLEKASRQDATGVEVHLGLSHAMAAEGDIEGCVKECDTILRLLQLPRNRVIDSLEDLANLHLRIADELKRSGRQAEINLAVKTAVLLNPTGKEAYKCLGSIHERASDFEVALQYYEKALLCSPSDAEIFSLMAGCYKGIGAREAAELCQQKAEEYSSAIK